MFCQSTSMCHSETTSEDISPSVDLATVSNVLLAPQKCVGPRVNADEVMALLVPGTLVCGFGDCKSRR